MKRIGILSDTHSCWDDRFSLHFADCDEIWHAGDVGDTELLERVKAIGPKVRAVSGNIDHGLVRKECPEILEFEMEGVRVLMSHIIGYPGRYARGARTMLIHKKPDLVIAGHSHILRVMFDNELNFLYVNPGAAGHHGFQKVRTLVKLSIDQNKFSDLEVIELQ